MDERCVKVDDCVNELSGVVSKAIKWQEFDRELRSLVPESQHNGHLQLVTYYAVPSASSRDRDILGSKRSLASSSEDTVPAISSSCLEPAIAYRAKAYPVQRRRGLNVLQKRDRHCFDKLFASLFDEPSQSHDHSLVTLKRLFHCVWLFLVFLLVLHYR